MGASVSRHKLRRSLPQKKPVKIACGRNKDSQQRPQDANIARLAIWKRCLHCKSWKVHAAYPDRGISNTAGSSLPHWWRQLKQGGIPRGTVDSHEVACQVDPSELAVCLAAPRASGAPINWRKGERIGSGAYGSVYMGLNTDTGELLAVKEVVQCLRDSTHQQEALQQLEQELSLLSKLSHPNVLRYLGTAREGSSLFIFLEYMPGGSIASLIGRFGPLNEPIIRSYTRQLLAGLAYLHAQRIVHRDIKGANLLLEKDGLVKLADMGMAKEMEAISVTASFKGSPFWMAPEVVRQQGHGWPADIWSVGCTVLEMATGKPPWSGCTTQVQAIFKIASSNEVPAAPETLSATGIDFVQNCLQRDPHQRPSAQQLLQHPWVAGVDVHVPIQHSCSVARQQPASSADLCTALEHLPSDFIAGGSDVDADQTVAGTGREAGLGRAQHPWLIGSSRTKAPVRNRHAAAGGTIPAGTSNTTKVWAWAGIPAPAGSGLTKQQSVGQATQQQQSSIGSGTLVATSGGSMTTAMADSQSAPGSFRPLRSRLSISDASQPLHLVHEVLA